MATVMTTIMLMLAVVLPAGNVNAKKHSECFKAGQSDGADHPFDASRFDRCGKNYQDGFLKGCKDAGNNEDTCQTAEDNQD
jgi:hypothetical protein